MKRFFMVTPQQAQQSLLECTYVPADNDQLAYGPTRFPAIPLINAHIADGERFEVVTVTYDTPECHANLETLRKEIESVCETRRAAFELTSVEVDFDDSIKAVLSTYQKLISHMEPGDRLYADITYGSKPMPIVLTMALQYAYRVKRDVEIECVVYGQIRRAQEGHSAKIYDVTALVQLDEIVRLMADGGVSDPEGVINMILGE